MGYQSGRGHCAKIWAQQIHGLSRTQTYANKDGYHPATARRRYRARRQKTRKIDRDSNLQAYIIDRLYEGFTPSAIAMRLKAFGAYEGIDTISPEAIYQWLYLLPQKRCKYNKLLPRHHARRGRRKRVHRGRIPERVSIHERPQHNEKRDEFRHWEVDLMSFQKNTQHLLVIHERKRDSRSLLSSRANLRMKPWPSFCSFFKLLTKGFVKSVTFDNGLVFSRPVNLRRQLQIPTYSCDVYASWQKGGIENMNGRLRRDLPRKTDLYKLQDEALEEIVFSHNLMPRHVLPRLFSPRGLGISLRSLYYLLI